MELKYKCFCGEAEGLVIKDNYKKQQIFCSKCKKPFLVRRFKNGKVRTIRIPTEFIYLGSPLKPCTIEDKKRMDLAIGMKLNGGDYVLISTKLDGDLLAVEVLYLKRIPV